MFCMFFDPNYQLQLSLSLFVYQDIIILQQQGMSRINIDSGRII